MTDTIANRRDWRAELNAAKVKSIQAETELEYARQYIAVLEAKLKKIAELAQLGVRDA